MQPGPPTIRIIPEREKNYFFAGAGFLAAAFTGGFGAAVLAAAFAGFAFAGALTAFAAGFFTAGFFAAAAFFALAAAILPRAMGSSQQMISASAQPHASSTTTTRPHSTQLR